jgi:hypothetical protein
MQIHDEPASQPQCRLTLRVSFDLGEEVLAAPELPRVQVGTVSCVRGVTFSNLSSVEAGDRHLPVSSASTMSDSPKDDIVDDVLNEPSTTEATGEHAAVDEIIVGVGTFEPRSETLDMAMSGVGLTGELLK